ncbi:MAG: hypothetical protein ACOX6D_02530 [Thermoguttaceae bacterium]
MIILTILNTVMTFGILIGVWWMVVASQGGPLKEVIKTFKELMDKHFRRTGE